MKPVFSLLFVVQLAFSCVHAQVAQAAFEKFAARQDSLFVDAYKKHDIAGYIKLLSEFMAQYDKLSKPEKRDYSHYLINAYYNLCCTYSLLDDKEHALQYFRKSIDAGFVDYDHIKEDKDLDNIRNEKEFIAESEGLRKVGDYLYILKKADKYNAEDNRPLPKFSYQSPSDPDLTALRKAFHLDSIAGQGNDISRIINLLHWVHDLIPHDGNHDNPVVKNAMSLIKECHRDKRGLNCRGLATVLNECYLSLGIKSRLVTCLPKDSLKIDNDCHVINMVYSTSLRKWLWIDPTNDAYLTDETGQMLSIEEVRERLIDDKPIILNKEANWNRQSVAKEDYLYHYMAKNLYMLECAVTSEYDYETRKEGKTLTYIKLLPLEYYDQSPAKAIETNKKTRITWVSYKTNNPALFWSLPE